MRFWNYTIIDNTRDSNARKKLEIYTKVNRDYSCEKYYEDRKTFYKNLMNKQIEKLRTFYYKNPIIWNFIIFNRMCFFPKEILMIRHDQRLSLSNFDKKTRETYLTKIKEFEKIYFNSNRLLKYLHNEFPVILNTARLSFIRDIINNELHNLSEAFSEYYKKKVDKILIYGLNRYHIYNYTSYKNTLLPEEHPLYDCFDESKLVFDKNYEVVMEEFLKFSKYYYIDFEEWYSRMFLNTNEYICSNAAIFDDAIDEELSNKENELLYFIIPKEHMIDMLYIDQLQSYKLWNFTEVFFEDNSRKLFINNETFNKLNANTKMLYIEVNDNVNIVPFIEDHVGTFNEILCNSTFENLAHYKGDIDDFFIELDYYYPQLKDFSKIKCCYSYSNDIGDFDKEFPMLYV